jgi:hypothetical protein
MTPQGRDFRAIGSDTNATALYFLDLSVIIRRHSTDTGRVGENAVTSVNWGTARANGPGGTVGSGTEHTGEIRVIPLVDDAVARRSSSSDNQYSVATRRAGGIQCSCEAIGIWRRWLPGDLRNHAVLVLNLPKSMTWVGSYGPSADVDKRPSRSKERYPAAERLG